ncbi:hypothetical protein V8D89_007428 [Ganoderma adspersum]
MQSLLLPWEVIERVITHSGDDFGTLLNFSLTCCNLRPRAFCLLVAYYVHFRTRVKVLDFCDLLQDKPHLKPFVHSVTVQLSDFAPSPLLRMVPNLSEIRFIEPSSNTVTPILHPSILKSCEPLGKHIQALCLSDLSFPIYLDFVRILLAFVNLADLVCFNVITTAEGKPTHLNALKQRPPRLHLRTIDIDYDFRWEDPTAPPSVATLLLDSGLVQSTMEALTVWMYRSSKLPHVFTWPRLWALTFKFYLEIIARDIPRAILFLKDFSPSTLTDVTVEMHSSYVTAILQHPNNSSGEDISRVFEELEQTLLRFSRPRIAWFLNDQNDFGISFWTEEIGKRLPGHVRWA